MDLFSYVIVEDSGFAPNPFGGFLTLACCKQRIRTVASVGDYIIGTGSSRTVGTTKLVYAGEISEVVTMEDYGKLAKFKIKQPSESGPWWKRLGDSIYAKTEGRWKQHANLSHGTNRMELDLSGKNILICKRFWYFGDHPEEIPTQFHEFIKKGPAHKRIQETPLVKQFLAWLNKKPTGIRSTDHLRDDQPQKCTPQAACQK